MEFEITVHIESHFRMQVKRIYEGDAIEKFEVTGGARTIVLRNNRPAIKGTRKKPRWQIEQGETPSSPEAFALTILAIEKKIAEIEKEPK